MKLMLTSLLAITTISFASWADGETRCANEMVALTLSPQSADSCPDLRLEGAYRLSLCDSKNGTLIGENGARHFLFRSASGWMARRDSLDLASGLTISEVLTLNDNLREFQFFRSISANNGTVPVEVECSGVITR